MRRKKWGGEPDRRGPAFAAGWGAECSNDGCLDGEFEEGDQIRADGKGGWECAAHKDEDG